MKNFWKERISEHLNIIQALLDDSEIIEAIDIAAKMIVKSYKGGGKLLICGNGGSAADSQHLAAELVSRFYLERKALDAEALSVNTSSITAIANDYSYEKIFKRQVEAKGKKGDVLIGISTSGNSENVIKAFSTAKEMGLITIGLAGNNKNSMIYSIVDHCVGVPSNITPRIQEGHILIGHMICEFIEKELFSDYTRKHRF